MALALRLIRAAAFAVVCVMVSAGGHMVAGGGALSALALVVSSAVPFALALVFNGRERACETVLAATAITQVVLHQVFAQIAPAVPAVSADAGHSHVNAGMALVHLTVALLSGWWLHQGESVVWTMLRLWATAPLRLLSLMPTAAVRAPAGRRPALFAVQSRPWRSREFAAAVRRRGPPLLAHAG
jgi:hypothetical protein